MIDAFSRWVNRGKRLTEEAQLVSQGPGLEMKSWEKVPSGPAGANQGEGLGGGGAAGGHAAAAHRFTPSPSASPGRIRNAVGVEDWLCNYPVTPAAHCSRLVLDTIGNLFSRSGPFPSRHRFGGSQLPRLFGRSPLSPASPDESFL